MKDYKLKIEVFKLRLNNNVEKVTDPTFRDLFKLKYLEDTELSDEDLFLKFNKDLSNKLDNKGEYHQLGKKAKKAFSVLEIPTLSSKGQYVYGLLKGGVKGDNKTSSDISDKNRSESLDNKVINNKHFFLLYTPLESNVGFLIFQSYPQENIRIDFATFLSRNIFKHGIIYNKIHVEPFLPEEIKEEFKTGATISQLTFTDRVLSNNLSDQLTIQNGTSHYRVKVIIEPTGEGELSLEKLDKDFISSIREKMAFGIPLKRFDKSGGKIKKDGRETTFKLGGIDEILPVIHLGEAYVDKQENPIFKEVKNYSVNLLEKIKKEFYEKTKASLIE